MALIECKSAQPGVPSLWVQVNGITNKEVTIAHNLLDQLIRDENQVSNAVARAFLAVVKMCPYSNPSDLWQHVIYRHLLDIDWSDNRWKRVSGFALERALSAIYIPRLFDYGIRIRIFAKKEANQFLVRLNTQIRSTKVDLFLEGAALDRWNVFGAVHVKSSLAERIQDDVPASRAFMDAGFLSIALTMDAKGYPPPHGDCVNYGELGGRSIGIDKERLKRNYIEEDGQFDGLFSFNLRTPPSPSITRSGKRIYTMSLNEKQPDKLVRFLVHKWETCKSFILS